jgi:hypothetical protein
MENKFKAGAGKAVLNFPPEYFPSEGYYGIHDNMHAKALLMESNGFRCGLVTLELPSIRPWELTDEVRAYAAKILGADFEHTWLIMTHDLSAPHVPTDETKRQLHMEIVKKAVKEACESAVSTLRDAVVGYGETTSDVNANRDVHSVDGWWVGVDGDGPSDKTLSLIKFSDLNGELIAVLYSYAIKSSLLEAAPMSDGKKYVSGDVTGVADSKVEEALGGVCMFVMGAAGDQVPKVKANYLALDKNGKFETVNLYEKGYKALETLSSTLANDIVASAKSTVCDDNSPVIKSETVVLSAQCKKPYPKTLPEPPVLSYNYEPDDPQELHIYSMRIGKASLIGLKAEVTTPIFDNIKSRSPFNHNLMATLVNGGQGYVATDLDYERFTYPGLNTPFIQGTDKAFEDKVVEELNRLIK